MVVVSYMGHITEMPITILENPVQSIAVTKAPSRVYLYGDLSYGDINTLVPEDMTGIELTVNFKDGTSEVYTDSDFDTKNKTVGGFDYDISYLRGYEIGSNTVKFSYRGFEASYNVTVKENQVEKIEVVKLPDNPVHSLNYDVDWRGIKLKFTYKNGTEKIVAPGKNDLFRRFNPYGYGMNYTAFEFDGCDCLLLRQVYSGGYRFTVRYGDASCEVTGITYREDKIVKQVDVEDFSYTGENMLIKATWDDGTIESVRLTDFVPVKGNAPNRNVSYVYADTDKGILTVIIPKKDSTVQYGFDVNVFGKLVNLDQGDGTTYIFGDANGDGRVTIDDVTELQKFTAKLTVSNAESLIKCGDVNRDGVINIIDVTAIQKYIAGYENIYGIGATFK
jgi:hypothetical protein